MKSSFFYFSDEELLIKDTDRKLLFDDLDSPTKADQTGLREKKVHVQKVTYHFQPIRNTNLLYYRFSFVLVHILKSLNLLVKFKKQNMLINYV